MATGRANRYPLRRVVEHWTTSEGVLVEQLPCGHTYVESALSGTGALRARRCQRCEPIPPKACVRCGRPLTAGRDRYCSRPCYRGPRRAPRREI